MEFNPHHGVDIQKKIQKFWGSLTSMITGGEHEYVYLRGIIDKIKYKLGSIKHIFKFTAFFMY